MSIIKPASTKDTVIQLMKLVDKKEYIKCIIHGLSGGTLTLISALALQYIVNAFTLHKNNLEYTIYIIAGYCIISSILQIITIQLERRGYCYFNFLRMDMLKKVIKKLIEMDYKYYEDVDFMNGTDQAFTAIESNDRGFEGIYHRVYDLGKKLVGALLFIILITRIHPLILLIIAIYVSINLSLLKLISNYRYKKRLDESNITRKISLYSKETSDFAYGKDIRLFQMGDRLSSEYKKEIKCYDILLKEFQRYELKLSLLDIICLIACNFTSFYMLGIELFQGMDLASYIMYLTVLNMFILLVTDISKDMGFIRQEFVHIKDLYGFLNLNLITEDKNVSFQSEGPIKVEFIDVSFKYPNAESNVYEHLNLTIESGKKVALVGINGAGKTTLVKLITGLYRPTSGKILINGVDYTTFSIHDLHNLYGVVFQDVHPLALTIKENISAKASENHIDETLVVSTLEQVGLWEKISKTEKVLDTMLLKIIDENGIVLSGGENQKLMIARALYRKQAKMMIMDEPTAALDALAEEKIYEEFATIMEGKTGLFISHRLASTRFCDYIVLLDGGKVAEVGNHEELMDRNGIYANMFATQGKYYQEVRTDEA